MVFADWVHSIRCVARTKSFISIQAHSIARAAILIQRNMIELLRELEVHVLDMCTGTSTLTLFVIALLLLTLYKWPVWNRHKYPPGPLPLPFIGHFHWYTDNVNTFQYLHEIKDRYPELITLDVPVGSKHVILNSAEAMYEGFVKQADKLSERPPSSKSPFTGGRGLINEQNGKWKELRRHAMSVFREKGVGKQGMEVVIHEELQHFCQVLHDTNEMSMDVMDLLIQAVSNVMTCFIFGSRFEYSNEKLANVQFAGFMKSTMKTQYLPLLRSLPFDPTGFYAEKRKSELGVEFARDQVRKHKEDIDYDNPRDYIDAFIIEINNKADDGESPFNEANLLASVMSLYVAGTDTTSYQLYWSFLYMVLYPQIQQKVYEEIERHFGERSVAYNDRHKMHYTMATTTELLRIGVGFTSALHFTTEDVLIRGYTIPKGTAVAANNWSILHSEENFEEPELFKPERFLDENGKFVKPDPKTFVAFGTGPRACLGVQLARAEVFLFLVTTLQKFKLELGQEKRPTEQGKIRFVWVPAENYRLKFIPR